MGRSFSFGSYGGTNTWGNRPEDTDANGNPIAGTSGASSDVDRYRNKGEAALNVTGPTIGSADMDQSRTGSMSAIDALRRRAGGEITPAQRQAAAQTAGAVAGIHSGAASIKGGAMARAAAARGATTTAARVGAMGAQDQQALAAREQADAAGQYFGAAGAQRGRDIGVATDRAKLDMNQRAANLQAQGFYEDLGFGTQKAQVDATLGRSAADVAASNSARAQATAADAASAAKFDRTLGTIVGGASGAVQAYGNTTGQPAPPAPSANSGGIIRNDPYAEEPEYYGGLRH